MPQGLLRLLAVSIGFVCLQLSGCSLSPVKTAQINTYTLAAKANAPAFSQRHQQVLLVTAPTAAPGYQSASMVYTLRPYELRSFARNRWTAPPAEMLAPLLAQNLQASGCFHAVVTPPFTGTVDLTLDSRLLALQQEFRDNNASQIRLVVQLTLSNNTSHQVMAERRLEALVPVAENNPYAGVVAANAATEIVLTQVRALVCH